MARRTIKAALKAQSAKILNKRSTIVLCFSFAFIFRILYLNVSLDKNSSWYNTYPTKPLFDYVYPSPNIPLSKDMVHLVNSTISEEMKFLKSHNSNMTAKSQNIATVPFRSSSSVKRQNSNMTAKSENITTVPFRSSSSPSIDILGELSNLTGGSLNKSIECPGALVPTNDKVIAVNSNITNQQLIPKILHLTFKSRCLPKDLASHVEKWKNALPNYSVFFHDDDAVNRLIYGNKWPEFPNLRKLMNCVQAGAMTIDVWRILILYKYGGIYSDIDNTPSDTFNEDLFGSDISAAFFSDHYGRPTQWFIASESRHKILSFNMRRILDQIHKMHKIHSPHIISVTGPDAFKHGYAQFIESHKPNQEMFKFTTRTLTGLLDKKVKKYGVAETAKFILTTPGYAQVVTHPFNSRAQVTRKERIELESGSLHWLRARREQRKDRKKRGSCKAYLSKLGISMQ